MIVGCARIILVFSFISTEVRGSENGVTETVFRKIFAPDSDVPVQYKSLEGNKLNPKEIYLEVNCIIIIIIIEGFILSVIGDYTDHCSLVQSYFSNRY